MPNKSDCLEISLPAWVGDYREAYSANRSIYHQMKYVIDAARQNVENETGGPFAAGIFEERTGSILSIGVNLVIYHNLSVLHAEVVALSFAQQQLQQFNLSNDSLPRYQLVSSSEPCAMCLGALPWSGIRRLICGATTDDARAIGFEEGDIDPQWQQQLSLRNITVTTQVMRPDACAVLALYQSRSGDIYNGNA
jgi:tRNA(Arg) A34 adenosine deaminase TadA